MPTAPRARRRPVSARALRRRVGDDAVDAHRGQQQRHGGEEGEQHEREAPRGRRRVRRSRRSAAPPRDAHAGIDGAQLAPHDRSEGERIARGADDEELVERQPHEKLWVRLVVGDVEVRLGWGLQARVTDVADDPDDLDRPELSGVPDEQAAARRGRARRSSGARAPG
jgi:hypothetical protein